MMNLGGSKGSCDTIIDPSGKTCVSNKTKDVNLIAFNIVKGINESKKITKLIPR